MNEMQSMLVRIVWAGRKLRLVLAVLGVSLGTVGVALAQTSCDATNRFTLDWNAQLPVNTALGTGNRVMTVTNAAGASVNVTLSFAGDTTHYVAGGAGQAPNVSIQNVGGIGAGEHTLYLATTFAGFTADVGTNTNTAVARLSFSTPVRDVNFTVLDIDFNAGQFRDWLRVGGSNVATYVPAISTPFGNNNSSNPGVTPNGVTYVGPGTTLGYNFPSGDAVGTGISANPDNFANVLVQFAQPITQAEIRYGNGPSTTITGTAGLQSISVHNITFCPMPALTVTKSVAPTSTLITDPNRFNIPGADVDYTITVTNSGGSTVDLSTTLIGDALPPEVTFFNGDIDGVTAGTQNFVFSPGTSGLTLAAANITYLNAGNGVITPAAGYDPLVRTVRWLPQGTMAANSSFTIRFRTRIN
jgi:uncharacterized repeat protein (TIGR01451 family)